MSGAGSWGGGYITDIPYMPGFYRQQMPSMMALVALLGGIAAPLPQRDDEFHFVDIGCGMGHSALIMAAANPGWRVTGIDFNPAHIAGARTLAHHAGIGNARFLEADLARLADNPAMLRDLPEFDAVSLHGVWTWVDEPVRAGIIRLLDMKLAPGGLAHVSYNVLPAWRGNLGMQRLMREAGLRLARRSDRQARRGFEIASRLARAEGAQAFIDGAGKPLFEHLAELPPSYLAHEFMNANWAPCYHLDVAARLAEAKLAYAGSASLLENFPALAMSLEMRAITEEFDDPAMAELIKDLCLARPLRHDVFVRGGIRLPPGRRDAALRALRLGLAIPFETRKLGFNLGAAEAEMNKAFYEPVFTRLASGPALVDELLHLPDAGGARDNPAELIGILVGTDQAVLLPNPDAQMDAASVRLNAVLFAEHEANGAMNRPVTLTLPALGGGFSVPPLAAYAVIRQHALLSEATIGLRLPEPSDEVLARWADDLLGREEPEKRQECREALRAFFSDVAPVLNRLGLPC
jgi:SAM-dependent methyltransferase